MKIIIFFQKMSDDENFEVTASPRVSNTFSFDEHMWDKLPEIEEHQKQGT